jgi:hypothetical protein
MHLYLQVYSNSILILIRKYGIVVSLYLRISFILQLTFSLLVAWLREGYWLAAALEKGAQEVGGLGSE